MIRPDAAMAECRRVLGMESRTGEWWNRLNQKDRRFLYKAAYMTREPGTMSALDHPVNGSGQSIMDWAALPISHRVALLNTARRLASWATYILDEGGKA